MSFSGSFKLICKVPLSFLLSCVCLCFRLNSFFKCLARFLFKYTFKFRFKLPSHVTAARCHMSPRRAVTCHRGVLSHVTAVCCHMSPRRAVTCHRGVLSHVTAVCSPMSPRRAVTCHRGVLSHVTAACCPFKFHLSFLNVPFHYMFISPILLVRVTLALIYFKLQFRIQIHKSRLYSKPSLKINE